MLFANLSISVSVLRRLSPQAAYKCGPVVVCQTLLAMGSSRSSKLQPHHQLHLKLQRQQLWQRQQAARERSIPRHILLDLPKRRPPCPANAHTYTRAHVGCGVWGVSVVCLCALKTIKNSDGKTITAAAAETGRAGTREYAKAVKTCRKMGKY